MSKCPYCNAEVSNIYYSTTCPGCGKSLHTCKTCAFYEPAAHYNCRETVDEFVQDKERPNFCEYFKLSDKKITKSNSKAAKDAFNSFFSV